ncbi:YifB family Mg chelatase-like AAA ATPase [Peptococcus simiae]|uniref:YifB family Mg chelatase-like AAA ATPase n=1 Tax=Peptococcus simiae TaxID=1643805 RepID=UPI00397F9FF6
MLAQLKSACLTGLEVYTVSVEIDAARGLPSWDIVGLPDTAVRESKERVHTALKNAGFDFPPRKIVVNLAPANLKKEGPSYDLPIALAILIATEQLPAEGLDQFMVLGELGLDGALHPVHGVLPAALEAKSAGLKMILPAANAKEAALSDAPVYGFSHLSQVIAFLKDPAGATCEPKPDMDQILQADRPLKYDFSDVKGQDEAKRALEIAAAGAHNVLFIGSPGVGKTMLARAFTGILPPLTQAESLETSKLYSVAGLLTDQHFLVTDRPFRSPHHSASQASLIGGGRVPRPGEVSLAHHGVLFMDELPEYRREVLEGLRQPLEDAEVTVSRVSAQVTYPCDFILLAAMNPCPCGYLNDPHHECTCTPAQVSRYRQRISGPLLDRFDIQIELSPVAFNDLYDKKEAESSATIRKRVIATRKLQLDRFADRPIFANGSMSHQDIRQFCALDPKPKALLRQAFERLGLSARAHDRILKLARTIADLDTGGPISERHIAEAIQYRTLDKKQWQIN